jgi:hypothetical protein
LSDQIDPADHTYERISVTWLARLENGRIVKVARRALSDRPGCAGEVAVSAHLRGIWPTNLAGRAPKGALPVVVEAILDNIDKLTYILSTRFG